MKAILILILTSLVGNALSQNGIIRGTVKDASSGELLPFVKLKLVPGDAVKASDIEGKFSYENLSPGNYSIEARLTGYSPLVVSDIAVSNAREIEVTLEMSASTNKLEELVIVVPFKDQEEAPVGLRNLSAVEIDRFPGANRDVSKAIQSLPGFSPQPSFRNDIVIRGGAPNENRFFY